jgi:hypothetical protein
MARLVSDAVTEVATILNDAGGVRYTPADIIRYTNEGVLQARSLRPDLFVGAYAAPVTQVTAVGNTIPLPDQLFTALCYYIAGRCELRDDEFAVDGRAMTLIPTLGKKLIQGG